jgi:hypothetical protein
MHQLRPTAQENRDTAPRARVMPLYAGRGSPHHDAVRSRAVARGPVTAIEGWARGVRGVRTGIVQFMCRVEGKEEGRMYVYSISGRGR